MQSEKINCLFLKDTHLAGRFPKSILYFIWRIFCHSLKFWFSQKTTIICLFVVLLIQYEKKNMKSCLLSDDKLWKHKIFFAIKVNNTVSKWGFFVQRKWEEEKIFCNWESILLYTVNSASPRTVQRQYFHTKTYFPTMSHKKLITLSSRK